MPRDYVVCDEGHILKNTYILKSQVAPPFAIHNDYRTDF